jgi:type IV pilus assembly protein PilW
VTRRLSLAAASRHQRGVGLIETLVGVTIGLVVVLVVYNLLAVSEAYKRTTTGYADAQVTGLIGGFITGQEAGNGGNGLSSAYGVLLHFHAVVTGSKFNGREDMSLKPIPVMITKSGDTEKSDSFLSRGSASIHVVWPVPLRPVGGVDATVLPGGPIQVQTPTGFMTPGKVSLPTATDPHWVVLLPNNGSGRCGLIQVIDATPAANPPMDDSGEVVLTQGAHASAMNYTGAPQNAAGTGAFLLNLGRDGDTKRVRYDVANGALRVTDCMTVTGCTGQTPQPIAQNIVLMKVQFGIDTSGPLGNGTLDATVDCWTSDDELCPVNRPGDSPPTVVADWEPGTLIKAGDPASPLIPANVLQRIVAVRIGLVVRSDEPDARDPALFVAPAKTIEDVTGTRAAPPAVNATYLFNCPANTDAGCQGRIPISAGSAATAIMQNGWRYRTYEAVIPLRNSIFAATLPGTP